MKLGNNDKSCTTYLYRYVEHEMGKVGQNHLSILLFSSSVCPPLPCSANRY
jgi:hypothetical protein